MHAREQLSALALAALVACALAKPEQVYPTKNSNLQGKIHKVIDGNGESTNSLHAEDVNSGNVVNNVVVPLPSNVHTNEVPQAPQLFQDVSKPVNLRFPHAVLFGGTCGGSIISPNWILTAGHCTLFTGGRYILAGTNNSEDGTGVTRRVKKLHIHPLFTVGPYWLNAERYGISQVAARYDYLLAELSEPLQLDNVTVAAVPLEDQPVLRPGTPVGYAGYGTDHHGGTMRSEMHAMDLVIQSDEMCRNLTQYNNKDMLCAQGYAPKFDSACNGDSGSGLVGDGRLLGIASWVQNDAFECRNGNLVVFSRVSQARQWIRDITGI